MALRVVGNADDETPSCLLVSGGPWPNLRVSSFGDWVPRAAERWVLEDVDGGSWLLEVTMPGLPEPLFEVGQELSLSADCRAPDEMFGFQSGSLRVDRGGELVVAVGQRAEQPRFQFIPGRGRG